MVVLTLLPAGGRGGALTLYFVIELQYMHVYSVFLYDVLLIFMFTALFYVYIQAGP